jgi:hypothetical protein
LLSVVRIVVVNGWRDVEMRSLVLTMATERTVVGEAASFDAGGAFPAALLRCVVVICCPRLVADAGAFEVGAGSFEVSGGGCELGAVVGSLGGVVGAGVGVARGVVAGGGAEDAGGAADVGELLLPLPVPEA